MRVFIASLLSFSIFYFPMYGSESEFYEVDQPFISLPEGGDDFGLEGNGPRGINYRMLVHNETHTIYRTAILGRRGLEKLSEYLDEEGLPFPRTIIYMNSFGYKVFDHALEEIDAQDEYGYRFYHSFGDKGERTYVDGHNPEDPQKDIDTTSILGSSAREDYGLQLLDNGVDGGMENFLRVLDLVLDPQSQPVLFHCLGGMHRTGMVGLVIRALQGGRWYEYKKKRWGMRLNEAEYEYYRHANRMLFRKENVRFVRRFLQSRAFQVRQAIYGPIFQEDG